MQADRIQGLSLKRQDDRYRLKVRLTPKQDLAFRSPAQEILFGGAAGAGKSFLIRLAALLWCLTIPGLQWYLFRRTFPELWDNHIDGPRGLLALQSMFPGQFRLVTGSRPQARFANGSVLHLCHCQYEKDRFKYQGAEIHGLSLDEMTTFTGKIIRYLRGRMRCVGVNVPEKFRHMFPRALHGTNPGGVGHQDVRSMFVDPQPPMRIWQTPDDEAGMTRQYIPALLDDNPFTLRDDPDYERRLQGLGDPELVKAYRWGIWDIVPGSMFADVWDPAVHVIQPFTLPLDWRFDLSHDYGESKPYWWGAWACAAGSWAFRGGVEAQSPTAEAWSGDFSERIEVPKGSLICIGEAYGWNGRPNEGIRATPREIVRHGLDLVEQLRSRGVVERNHRLEPGPGDVPERHGDRLMRELYRQEGITITQPDKTDGSRALGARVVRQMLSAAKERSWEEPWLLFTDDCRHVIRTLPALTRDERKPDDVNTNDEDHPYDGVRYRVMDGRKGPRATRGGKVRLNA